MTLETPRLILREFCDDDLAAVQEYASDIEVVRYEVWGPNTEAETAEFLKLRQTLARVVPRTDFEMAVTLKESGRLIGSCGLRHSNPPMRNGDLGYLLNRGFWGQGYASEAASALIAFGFRELKLHRIWATCTPDNVASRRVLEKCGMEQEGHLRHPQLCRGAWQDLLLYAILETA